jgi:hypothetical protein
MYKTSAATGIVLWFHCGKLLGKLAEGRLSPVDTMPSRGKGPSMVMCGWEHFQTQTDAISCAARNSFLGTHSHYTAEAEFIIRWGNYCAAHRTRRALRPDERVRLSGVRRKCQARRASVPALRGGSGSGKPARQDPGLFAAATVDRERDRMVRTRIRDKSRGDQSIMQTALKISGA